MKGQIITAMFFLFSASQALAYTDAGGRYTSGPNGYAGVNAFAEWGNDDHYLRPSVNTYKSDLADRYSTYSLGAGLERGRWSAGGDLSFTPETGGYKNAAAYADLSYRLLGEPADGAALQDASLGVFAGYTAHEDDYAASTAAVSGGGSGRRTSVSTLTSSFKLGQADYGVSAALKLCGLRVSGRFTKTAYNKDVTAEARRLPIDIGGIGASGFPDAAVSVRLRAADLPLSPEAGYARTTYLIDQPASQVLNAGISLRAGPAEVSAGWENFNPGGGAARSEYYSVGVTWSFGD